MKVWKGSRISEVLVGAVGIENNGHRNFKDLREMRGNPKSLKRNDGEQEAMPIAPLKLPRFSCFTEVPLSSVSLMALKEYVGFGPKFCGTDGESKRHFRTHFFAKSEIQFKHGLAPCLGRALSDSNSSINYFHFSVFSVIWGICFSLKANPNGMKRSDSGTLLAQGTHRRDVSYIPLEFPRCFYLLCRMFFKTTNVSRHLH